MDNARAGEEEPESGFIKFEKQLEVHMEEWINISSILEDMDSM